MSFKKIFFCLCGIMVICSLQAQSRYKYIVSKVADDIYVLKPDENHYRWVTSNIVVIINEQDVFVIDSGLLPSAAEEAIAEIKKLTSKPVKYLVNTHWHGDHWQGNESFVKHYPQIKIVSSAANKTAIERNGLAWVKIYYPRYLNMMVEMYEKSLKDEKEGTTKDMSEEEEKEMEQGITEVKLDIKELATLSPTLPTETFTKKMILRSGKRTVELHYLGPGNTIGDVVIYLPKEKILVPGDLVVFPSPFESGSFSQDWIETSQKLQHDFKYQQLIPGHGAVQQDTVYLSYLNALFKEIVRQMDAAYRSGKSQVEEAVSTVTHKSVIAELEKNESYKKYVKRLDPGFVKESVKHSFLSYVNGKVKVQ